MVWNLEQYQCHEKKNVGTPALKENKENNDNKMQSLISHWILGKNSHR